MTLSPFSHPAATQGITSLGSWQHERQLCSQEHVLVPLIPLQSLVPATARSTHGLDALSMHDPHWDGASVWHEGGNAVSCTTGAQ